MAHVKNYNPGHIRLDLPSANYIYELPLFAYSDTVGSLGISLIFNYHNSNESDNPFLFKPGYKLNIQKRLVIDSTLNKPTHFQNEYGKRVSLYKYDDSSIYFLDDESQRYVFKSGSFYVLVNPDDSRETYDLTGRFIFSEDKYFQEVLYCQYNTSGVLTKITYREKQIIFTYDAQSRISRVSFLQNYVNFSYTNSGINVSFSSGDVVCLESSAYNFTASAGELSGGTSFECKRKTNISGNDQQAAVVISSSVCDKVTNDDNTVTTVENVTDSTSYTFPDVLYYYDDYFNQVEITDIYGVKTRIQYQGEKAQYSYEVNGSDVSFIELETGKPRFSGTVTALQTESSTGTVQAAGRQLLMDGMRMKNSTQYSSVWEIERYTSNTSNEGYYVISGWFKVPTNSSQTIELQVGNVIGLYNDPYVFSATPNNQWKYFSILYYSSTQDIYLHLNSPANAELKDVRITYREDLITTDKTGKTHLAIVEDGLVYHANGHNSFIPLSECEFRCNGVSMSSFGEVHFEDVLKNKINYKRNYNLTEFFLDKISNVFPKQASHSITVIHEETEYGLNDLYPARRQYVNGIGYVTTRVVDDNSSIFLIYQTLDKSGNILSSQKLNNKLDAYSVTKDGITLTYTRDTQGRITAESAQNSTGSVLYSRTTAYGTDGSGNPTVTYKDEFNKTTSYTLDRNSGNVISVALPDGSVVRESFDDSKSSLVERVFSDTDNTGSRTVSFGYEGGFLSSVGIGDLNYSYEYFKDELTSVSKGVPIEEYEHELAKTTAYYPSKNNKSYQTVTNFDKYRRITSVDGLISNEYDIVSRFGDSGALVSYENNADALLVTATDNLKGQIARFEYDAKNRLVKESITSKTDYTSKDRDFEFTYDKAGRVTSHKTVIYDSLGSKTLTGEIAYTKSESDADIDGTVLSYTYKEDFVTRSISTNTYDTFKRNNIKTRYISGEIFTKELGYTKTRITSANEYYGDPDNLVSIGSEAYKYDDLGRIDGITYNTGGSNKALSYGYNIYGQLVRENNQALNKTYTYSYDDIGNVTSVKGYSYTTGTPSGTPSLTRSFAYDSTHKDRLINYNGNAITYNNAGYLSSYNGKNYTWQRGKLSGITKGNPRLTTGDFEITSFTYDGYGQRKTKSYKYESSMVSLENSNPIRVTQYSYDHSGRIAKETCTETFKNSTTTNTHRIVYLYDESGVIGLMYGYNTTTLQPYYYQRNLQGDVVAIRNTSGNKVAEYAYDAWGNCTVVSSTNATLANYNPIRYRGYYLDRETGLYYCNARYYNPEWRRFLSHDDTSYLNPENFSGLNLYAYCYNNPMNYKQRPVSSGSSIIISSISSGGLARNKISGNAVQQIAKILSSKSSGFNLFGYELRTSTGWDTSPDIATSFFGRIGFSSYVTYTQGQSGMLYAFAGSTSDVMNWFGTTYYAGVGINLFDIVGVEAYLETTGIGAQVSIGNFSIGANINLIGGTSITFGMDTDLGNGFTKTKGFTVGVNTGCLVAVIYWIYKFVATGDPSPVPVLQPV